MELLKYIGSKIPLLKTRQAGHQGPMPEEPVKNTNQNDSKPAAQPAKKSNAKKNRKKRK